jgi:tetratricopeptide (TPR) repeat protein
MADEGLLREALENFNKAIDTNPNNHIAFFNRATIKIDLGDLEGAKNDFHKFDLITKT